MPTDLPPDYKPQPASDPAHPDSPGPGVVPAPPQGEDARDPQPGGPLPDGDVVDPPGWAVPPIVPGGRQTDVPLPAGTPTF